MTTPIKLDLTLIEAIDVTLAMVGGIRTLRDSRSPKDLSRAKDYLVIVTKIQTQISELLETNRLKGIKNAN